MTPSRRKPPLQRNSAGADFVSVTLPEVFFALPPEPSLVLAPAFALIGATPLTTLDVCFLA
jgi:hypothetical protein